MEKVLNYCKRNIKVVVAFICGVIISGGAILGAVTMMSSSSVNVDTTNMPLLGNDANLTATLDYLYEKASHVGECPEGMVCKKSNPGYLPVNDNATYTQSTFAQSLQVGDLIKMTPVNTSVRIDGIKSGYTTYVSTATYLDPSELEYWRVIHKNTNGTIDVLSEFVSSITVIFSDTPGYANLVGYLNELASYYENPKYTVGSRYIGYNGQTEYITNTSAFDGSSNSAPWTHTTNNITTSSEEALGAGDKLYQTDYDLVKVAYGGTANSYAVAKKVGTTTATSYWLASRWFGYLGTTEFRFCNLLVNTSGNLYNNVLRIYNNGWNGGGHYGALRPILTLKSTIASDRIEEGTGAYILS